MSGPSKPVTSGQLTDISNDYPGFDPQRLEDAPELFNELFPESYDHSIATGTPLLIDIGANTSYWSQEGSAVMEQFLATLSSTTAQADFALLGQAIGQANRDGDAYVTKLELFAYARDQRQEWARQGVRWGKNPVQFLYSAQAYVTLAPYLSQKSLDRAEILQLRRLGKYYQEMWLKAGWKPAQGESAPGIYGFTFEELARLDPRSEPELSPIQRAGARFLLSHVTENRGVFEGDYAPLTPSELEEIARHLEREGVYQEIQMLAKDARMPYVEKRVEAVREYVSTATNAVDAAGMDAANGLLFTLEAAQGGSYPVAELILHLRSPHASWDEVKAIRNWKRAMDLKYRSTDVKEAAGEGVSGFFTVRNGASAAIYFLVGFAANLRLRRQVVQEVNRLITRQCGPGAARGEKEIWNLFTAFQRGLLQVPRWRRYLVEYPKEFARIITNLAFYALLSHWKDTGDLKVDLSTDALAAYAIALIDQARHQINGRGPNDFKLRQLIETLERNPGQCGGRKRQKEGPVHVDVKVRETVPETVKARALQTAAATAMAGSAVYMAVQTQPWTSMQAVQQAQNNPLVSAEESKAAMNRFLIGSLALLTLGIGLPVLGAMGVTVEGGAVLLPALAL